MTLKILSWNIWIDGYFDQVTDFLKKSDADIIGLQEVREDDPSRETIKYLKAMGYNHAFAPIKKAWGGKIWNDGPAIFTKYNIVSTKKYTLSEEDSRAAIQADIRVGDKIIHVFSTHLVHTHQQESEIQTRQAEDLLKLIPTKMSILMGDFNAVPESTTIQKIKKVMIDSDPASSPTWSAYPTGCAACNPQEIDTRLDYIFTTKDIKTHSYNVENSKGSDHLPISVIVEI